MSVLPRHQCLIYDGSPAKMLPVIAAQVRDKLNEKFKCLYLNSPAMVAGMKSYLYAAGVNVREAEADGSLILSSEPSPLKARQFDVQQMLDKLEQLVNLSLNEGYCGLWATGDMSWEMGTDRDLKRLLEYEWKLEQLFEKYPGLSGICQYHADTLPRDLVCHSLLVHPAIFINDTLARANSSYIPSAEPVLPIVPSQELKLKVTNLCSFHPE
jgi:hypothetical protein